MRFMLSFVPRSQELCMTIIHRRAFFFGVDRTACDSVRVREFRAVVNALSVSMGIKITYGSYVKKDVNLGKAGTFVDARFFITAIFATLTSCISILESIAANCVEIFHTERKRPFSCSASSISRRAPSLRWAMACSILNCRFPTARSANCWTAWTTSATPRHDVCAVPPVDGHFVVNLIQNGRCALHRPFFAQIRKFFLLYGNHSCYTVGNAERRRACDGRGEAVPDPARQAL